MEHFAIFRGQTAHPVSGLPDKVVPVPTPDSVSAAAARVAKTLGFTAGTMCMPISDRDGISSVALIANREVEDDSFRVLVKHVAIELGCEVFSGVDSLEPFCRGDDDCDLSFLDRFPTQEEEIGAIWLKFTIERPDMSTLKDKLMRICRKNKYDCEFENDGAVVYISTTIALDLFYDDTADEKYIDGELDSTYAGAGIYAEACEFARELAKALDGELVFRETDRVSYPIDGDFDKLRTHFHEAMRQQLAFAGADDRDGFQAYIGWSVDTFEPEEIPGTVITHLGRYELDRIYDEITAYGFEAVADKRFLVRNTRYRSSDEAVKSALALLWAQCSPERFVLRSPNEPYIPEQFALRLLEEAFANDPCPCIPIEEYSMLRGLCVKSPEPPKKCTAYQSHYPIGYLRSDISYGFGSYLRRVKLPGSYIANELKQGEHIVIGNRSVLPFGFMGAILPPLEGTIGYDIKIEYADDELSVSDEFLSKLPGEIMVFDIGGNSRCRAVVSDEKQGSWYSARAEIVIRDERYLIECKASERDKLDGFADLIAGSRAVEEVDDLPTAHPDEKPRAWGACYYKRGGNEPSVEELCETLERMLQPTKRPMNLISFIPGPATETNSKFGGIPYLPEGDGEGIPTVAQTPETLADGTAGDPLDFLLQLNFDDFDRLPGFPEKGILQLWCYAPPEKEGFELFYRDGTYFRVRFYPDPIESVTVCEEQTVLILANRFSMPMSPEDKRFDELPEPTRNTASKLMRLSPDEFDRHFCKDGSWIGGYRTAGRSDECYEAGGELILQIMTPLLNLALMIEPEDLAALRFDRTTLFLEAPERPHELSDSSDESSDSE